MGRALSRPVRHRFQVSEQDQGLRLDQLMARHVPGLSRGKARLVLELGGVFVDRKRVKVSSRKLRPGQWVEVHVGSAVTETQGSAKRAPLEELSVRPRICFVDEHVVVVDKPSGALSAPTPESDRHDLLAWLHRELGGQLHLVHRLDRPTSGLLVYARSPHAAARLGEALALRALSREYLLAVQGSVPWERREVSSPVRGKPASTLFWRVERRGDGPDGSSLLGARLKTGRTHQIRVHAASIGHPLAGDERYGAARVAGSPPRVALHAFRLAFPHPVTGEARVFEAPWPEDLAAWWGPVPLPPPDVESADETPTKEPPPRKSPPQ